MRENSRMGKFLFLISILGFLHLCWFLAVGPFNTWLISSWEKNNYCYKLSNWQNDNYFHSKLQFQQQFWWLLWFPAKNNSCQLLHMSTTLFSNKSNYQFQSFNEWNRYNLCNVFGTTHTYPINSRSSRPDKRSSTSPSKFTR